MHEFSHAIGSPWWLFLLALGIVSGPLAARFVGRRRERFRRRLESAYAHYGRSGPDGSAPGRDAASLPCDAETMAYASE